MTARNANLWVAVAGTLLGAAGARQCSTAEPITPRLEFTRMLAHWDGYATPDYLKFVDEARPELVQLGFYGAHFWSLADTPDYGGYPAHLPVRGHTACAAWFAERNRELHRRGIKVVGHFNMTLISGAPDGPDGPTGFFKFYRDQWDSSALGKRPATKATDLLEQDTTGRPLQASGDATQQYWACLRNPAWQAVLKAWVGRAIDLGVDGLMANYFYRHDCVCEHCQTAFCTYLAERYKPEELLERFGIDDVARHRFAEIVSWHDPATTTPLRLEMLRFSQVSNKQVFDELLLRYARSRKPDFIAAQWNHLGQFDEISGDERCLLPADLWSRDESYLWYSTGGSATYTDLPKHVLGEATLQARYVRGASGDKPYTIGKYEGTRIRVAIAELAANGGAPMGFYTRFADPAARHEIVRYYRFIKRYDALYRSNQSAAEAVLLFPRAAVHQGTLAPVAEFRTVGKSLMEAHVLFDVLPDDLATPEVLRRYKAVYRVGEASAAGSQGRLSNFAAPYYIRVSATKPREHSEVTIHFINYNRQEPPPQADGSPSPGSGIVDERPIATKAIKADLVLPPGAQVRAVEVISPEKPEPQRTAFKQTADSVHFTMPSFLVYGVARVKFASPSAGR